MGNSRLDGTGHMAAGLTPDRIVVRGKFVQRDPCARCGTRGDVGCQHEPCRLVVTL